MNTNSILLISGCIQLKLMHDIHGPFCQNGKYIGEGWDCWAKVMHLKAIVDPIITLISTNMVNCPADFRFLGN